MAKPVFLRGNYFKVTDYRRGKDYKYTKPFQGLVALFKDNAEAIDELASLILEDGEFDTPVHVKSIDIRLMGKRKSFLGQAHRTKGYIKMTPQRDNYHDGQDVETFVHELAHIACSTEYKFNGRRVIHGRKFKATVYKIAQYAHAVGLLRAEQVRREIGMASHHNMNEAAQKPAAKTTPFSPKFKVGDIVAWTHSGYKHGGSYTGRVKRVNKKTYTVIAETKNGKEVYGGQWKLPIGRQHQYTLVE